LLKYGERIEIVPVPSVFYTLVGVTNAEGLNFDLTAGVSFDLYQDRNIILNFESKRFTMPVGGLPAHTLRINNVVQETEQVTFVVGDKITIAFETSSTNVLGGMKIDGANADTEALRALGMVYKNGTLTIDVTVGWLEKALGEGWLSVTSTSNTFDPTIEVATPVNPLIIGAGATAGVIALLVIIGIILIMISIKKKKADYVVALAKQKEGQARLRQNIASDLLKD